MKSIQKKIVVKIDDISYEMSFPNVGQYMEIENLRTGLTNGKYTEMYKSGLKSSFFNIELVDCLSILYVICPQILRNLNVTNYNDLDLFTSKKLIKVYREQIRPWYDNLMDLLLDDSEDIKEPLEEPKKKKKSSQPQDDDDFETIDLG